jgi:hypothetical protein
MGMLDRRAWKIAQYFVLMSASMRASVVITADTLLSM